MALPSLVATLLPRFVLRYAQRLRFPQLFLLFAVLFAADFFIPDFVPFIDEIFFGLMTLIFAAFKKQTPLTKDIS